MKKLIAHWNPGIKAIVFLFLLSFVSFAYALPFTIVPKAGTSLPTSVAIGSSVPAYYTVTNNTATTRSSNHVKYLPPNVTQTTKNATYLDTCSASFSLRARESCTLQLNVSGAVNGNDPDPHHHLFVCFPGDKTCAGTFFP